MKVKKSTYSILPITYLLPILSVGFCLLFLPRGVSADQSLLAEKDLEIRNLQRRVFDLESKLPTDNRAQKLRAEIKRLKDIRRSEISELIESHQLEIKQLQDQVTLLEKQLVEQKKLLKQELDSGQKQAQEEISSLQKDIKKKEQQLIKSNEVLTLTMAENATLEDRMNTITEELRQTTTDLTKVKSELSDRQKIRKKLIERTERPLRTTITDLERQLALMKEVEKKLNKELKQAQFDLHQSDSRGVELRKEFEKLEKELSARGAKIEKLQGDKESTKSVRKQMKQELKVAQEVADKKILGLTENHSKLLRERDRKIEQLQQQISTANDKMTQLKSNHSGQIEVMTKKLKSATEASRDVKLQISKAAKTLNGKIQELEKSLKQNENELKRLQEKKDLLGAQLADKDEKIAVYKKLVDKQEKELEGNRSLDLVSHDSIDKKSAAERKSLTDKIASLQKQLSEANKKMVLHKKEWKSQKVSTDSQVKEELSSVKIDLEYKTNKYNKLVKEHEQLENTLLALQNSKEGLRKRVKSLEANQESTMDLRKAASEAREAKIELEERLEILLQENADYQKRVLELTTMVKGIANSDELVSELEEAQSMILAFKKDVDAKTIEISGLVSENQDLRKRLRQSIKDSDQTQSLLKQMKAKQMATISDEEIMAMQEQINSLRTALSKARQMIAQNDVALEGLEEDKSTLKVDVERLTQELSVKIKEIGELQYARRSAAGAITDDELQSIKKPLLVEISVLKQRVAQLEKQLLETWNRAEGMLLELKNHPQIKQADVKKLLETDFLGTKMP